MSRPTTWQPEPVIGRPHASLIAADLTAFLRSRAATFESPVYGLSLFVGYGYLGVGVGTEADFARRTRVPIYDGLAEDRLSAPAGPRWDTGAWSVVAEDFLTDRTKHAMRRRLRTAADGDGIRGALALTGLRRTCVRALARLPEIPELPGSGHLITFVEEDDSSASSRAHLMLATVPRHVLRETFPHWERLGELVQGARRDVDVMADLRARVALRERSFPKYEDPAPDELTAVLRDCGLRWHDVTTESAALRTALRVSAALGAGR